MPKRTTRDAETDDTFDVSPEALTRAIMDDNNKDPDSSQTRLKSFIERYERLADEKQAITDDMKEVLAEAKGTGFDVKIMRQVIRRRKMEKAERDEQDELLDLYERALGDRL